MKTVKATLAGLPDDQRIYLYAYTVLVLLLSLPGGTDFFRFATFLFLPQIILLGFIAPQKSNLHIGLMLAVTFIFNRIWLPFPIGGQGTIPRFLRRTFPAVEHGNPVSQSGMAGFYFGLGPLYA